jgi:hypothetical protein
MKLSLALVLSILLGACATKVPASTPIGSTASAGGDLTITYVPVVVGERRTDTQEVVMTMRLATPEQTFDVVTTSHEVKTVEVLALDGERARKARVTYGQCVLRRSLNGNIDSELQPYSGMTYVIERVGDALQVYLEDGTTPATGEVAAAVAKDNKRFGGSDTDAMEKLISRRTWRLGEPVALTPEELRLMADGSGSGPALQSTTLTLRGVEGGIASFDTAMTMSEDLPRGRMAMTLEGVSRFDVSTARAVELSVSGSLSGELNGSPMTGTMEMRNLNTL